MGEGAARPRALQKCSTGLAGAKRFGAAGARRGVGSTHITVFKAVLKAGSTNEFVQKAGVETVACPDGIYGLNGERSRMKTVFAAFGECALRSALDNDDGDEPGKDIERVIEGGGACECAR